MCGLVGIVNLDGARPEPALLHAMGATIAHRGPDDDGMHIEDNVGLYHRRLAIIDLVSGHQPMSFDGVTVAYNGEIYNYVELREALARRGHAFRTGSDTEVLLRAYLEYGVDVVTRLNGMFAFVLLDTRARRIVAARDHFGIKPLYYTSDGARLLYASEIKALLAHPQVRAEPDPVGLQDYVTFQFTLGETTLFKNIRKLPPAHVQVVDLASRQIQTRRYWEPAFGEPAVVDEHEAIARLRFLIEDSVRLQMRSDVPVGAYLSGGLDSSAVTMLAARHTETALQTFTGAFREGPEYDETRYARTVAEAAGARNLVVYPTESDFVELLPTIAYHMDEPAAGPGLFPQYLVSRAARRHVKVCLGGQGGDELYAGYARYLVAYVAQALKHAITGESEEGEAAIPLEQIAPRLPLIRQYQPMLRRLLQGDPFDSMAGCYFRLIDRTEGMLDLYSPDFRASYDRTRVFERFRAVFERPATRSYFDRMISFDAEASLPALLHVEDRVSMAVSLESRVPLLDYRIADFLASVPPAAKFKGGELKYLFKRALEPVLPPEILRRTDKMGFPVPLQQWARGRAREFFNDVLLSRACRERGLFDMAAVQRLIEQDAAYGRALWGLLQMELWHQRFIDRAVN